MKEIIESLDEKTYTRRVVEQAEREYRRKRNMAMLTAGLRRYSNLTAKGETVWMGPLWIADGDRLHRRCDWTRDRSALRRRAGVLPCGPLTQSAQTTGGAQSGASAAARILSRHIGALTMTT